MLRVKASFLPKRLKQLVTRKQELRKIFILLYLFPFFYSILLKIASTKINNSACEACDLQIKKKSQKRAAGKFLSHRNFFFLFLSKFPKSNQYFKLYRFLSHSKALNLCVALEGLGICYFSLFKFQKFLLPFPSHCFGAKHQFESEERECESKLMTSLAVWVYEKC